MIFEFTLAFIIPFQIQGSNIVVGSRLCPKYSGVASAEASHCGDRRLNYRLFPGMSYIFFFEQSLIIILHPSPFQLFGLIISMLLFCTMKHKQTSQTYKSYSPAIDPQNNNSGTVPRHRVDSFLDEWMSQRGEGRSVAILKPTWIDIYTIVVMHLICAAIFGCYK